MFPRIAIRTIRRGSLRSFCQPPEKTEPTEIEPGAPRDRRCDEVPPCHRIQLMGPDCGLRGRGLRPMTKKPKSDYAIQAVANALRLLHVFRDEREIGVAELARRLGLPKNNVFRLLATMEEQGFIDQCRSTGRYRLGLECYGLGEAFKHAHPVLERARPVLDQLLEKTGETVHLAVRDGFEVVHLDARAPLREITAAVRTGRRAPLH